MIRRPGRLLLEQMHDRLLPHIVRFRSIEERQDVMLLGRVYYFNSIQYCSRRIENLDYNKPVCVQNTADTLLFKQLCSIFDFQVLCITVIQGKIETRIELGGDVSPLKQQRIDYIT